MEDEDGCDCCSCPRSCHETTVCCLAPTGVTAHPRKFLKYLLFIPLLVFIVWLPLGDPKDRCACGTEEKKNFFIHFLCVNYKALTRALDESKKFVVDVVRIPFDFIKDVFAFVRKEINCKDHSLELTPPGHPSPGVTQQGFTQPGFTPPEFNQKDLRAPNLTLRNAAEVRDLTAFADGNKKPESRLQQFLNGVKSISESLCAKAKSICSKLSNQSRSSKSSKSGKSGKSVKSDIICPYDKVAPSPTNTKGAPSPTNTKGAPSPTSAKGAQSPTNTKGAPSPINAKGAASPTSAKSSPNSPK